MADARVDLLERTIAEVAHHGLGDRSLRDIAAAIGSSHRMLLYHFGSRPGLVQAIVERVEADQRAVFLQLAATARSARELVESLWSSVSAPDMLPFVRLFFEAIGTTTVEAPDAVTKLWIDESAVATAQLGVAFDPVETRLGVAITRGLLIDVLTNGDAAAATAALHLFLDRWSWG